MQYFKELLITGIAASWSDAKTKQLKTIVAKIWRNYIKWTLTSFCCFSHNQRKTSSFPEDDSSHSLLLSCHFCNFGYTAKTEESSEPLTRSQIPYCKDCCLSLVATYNEYNIIYAKSKHKQTRNVWVVDLSWRADSNTFINVISHL